MASPASSSLSSPAKAVHFDAECVIIPSSRPQPRLVSKTFSVPLWRSAPDKEPAQLTFRVPSITTGRPRVPSRDARPSPSCLASPHAHQRERSDPIPSPTEELGVLPIPIRGRGRSASTPATAASPVVIVPLRGCCAECMPTVDAALCVDYEEKWTRGARRRRRSSSSASESGPAPLGSRLSIDLVRVDELPASAVDVEDSFSDDLFPLPCGKRKVSASNPALLSCGDDDSGSGSGSLTPQSSDEIPAPSTPGLTPTSELDEPPLLPRTPPPLMIPMSKPILVPVIKEPGMSPPSSPTSSPVRARLLSASATFIRGTIAAAASVTPTASVGIR